MNNINKGYQKRIFPITYFQDNIDNNDKIKDIIVPKIKEDYNKLPIPEGWITNKVNTSFSSKKSKKQIFFGEDEIYEKYLSSAYEKCFDNFFDTRYQISIDDIWYNYYRDDEYQEFHHHLGSLHYTTHFSCIHFLSFDPNIHQPTVFKDPNESVRYHSMDFSSSGYKCHHIPEIKEGDLIMFPSYLEHCVYPVKNTKEYPRITISLNIRLLDYGNEQ